MFPLQSADLPALAKQLSAVCQFPVQCVASIGSSNDVLLQQAAQLPLYPQPACALLALHQTAGRGRRGRVWQAQHLGVAPAFLASLGGCSSAGAATIGLLPLRLGMAVAVLLRQWGCAAQIKWPNDLQIETAQGTAKLGGILVESRPVSAGAVNISAHAPGATSAYPTTDTHSAPQAMAMAVVMGLGLNWHSAPVLGDRLTSYVLANTSRAPAPHAAAADLLCAMQAAWQASVANTAATLAPSDFAAFDALYDCPVTAQAGNHAPVHGIAKGINAQGQLGLQGENGLVWLSSGEVTVRVAA